MNNNQINFCKDFNELMEKYNISNVGGLRPTIFFTSNGEDFLVNGYTKETGLQVFPEHGLISTKEAKTMREIKQYILAEDVKIAMGLYKPEEPSHLYCDNNPTVTLYSEMIRIDLFRGDDDQIDRILMTPEQARGIAKYLKRFAKSLEPKKRKKKGKKK